MLTNCFEAADRLIGIVARQFCSDIVTIKLIDLCCMMTARQTIADRLEALETCTNGQGWHSRIKQELCALDSCLK